MAQIKTSRRIKEAIRRRNEKYKELKALFLQSKATSDTRGARANLRVQGSIRGFLSSAGGQTEVVTRNA